MGHYGTNLVLSKFSHGAVEWCALVCPQYLFASWQHGMGWYSRSPNGCPMVILDNHLNLDSAMSQAYDGASEIMLKYGQEIKPKHAQKIILSIWPINQAKEIKSKMSRKSNQSMPKKKCMPQEIKPKYHAKYGQYCSHTNKGPLTKERPPPTFCSISCIGSKFT